MRPDTPFYPKPLTAWASFFKTQDPFRMDRTDPRQNLIVEWLNGPLSLTIDTLEPVSQDASFRRYFRIFTADGPRIVMDAPPPNEAVVPFIEQAERLRRCGLRTPRIDAVAEPQGLLLLEDFGSTAYLDVLNEATAEELYGAALAISAGWPGQPPNSDKAFPTTTPRCCAESSPCSANGALKPTSVWSSTRKPGRCCIKPSSALSGMHSSNRRSWCTGTFTAAT